MGFCRTRRSRSMAALVFPYVIWMASPAAAENPPALEEYYVFDKAPRPVKMVPPDYPKEARNKELQGRVVVKLTMDEKGKVIHAEVTDSTAEIFNEPALTAIRQWEFEPAESGGKPVKATIVVPLEFTLNRGGSSPPPGMRVSKVSKAPEPPTIRDERPDVVQVCELALGVDAMEDHWPAEGAAPLYVLWNPQLRQFGQPSILALEKFGEPVVVVKKQDELADHPFIEFSRIAIQEKEASVEFDYRPAGVHCSVKLSRSEGAWEVKKTKVKAEG